MADSWDDAQEFIERPRMRDESEGDHATRRAVARLSREIRASLQAARNRMDFVIVERKWR